MSRIDEALKRAEGTGSGRSTARSHDVPLRLADESTLNEYPVEARSTTPRVDRLESPIEQVSPMPRRDEGRRAVITPAGPLRIRPNEKLVVGGTGSPASMEQYRRLAATLYDAQEEKGLKVLMVTSTLPREGKTLTVVNLALTLSESYRRRVLVIDADLRRPSVHEVLGIPNERGLSEALRSDRHEPATIQMSSHLSVLPSGRPDQNPLAGLSSDRMRLLLEEMAPRYDWILLDTPPVGLLSDAQVLTRLVQGVLFVIRAGSTPYPMIEKAIGEIGRDSIVGSVLNGVDDQVLPSPGYYGSYYKR